MQFNYKKKSLFFSLCTAAASKIQMRIHSSCVRFNRFARTKKLMEKSTTTYISGGKREKFEQET